MRSGSGGRRRRSAAITAMITALLAGAHVASAQGAVAHTVIEGETLSGIAAANGISTESLASWNGIAADTFVITGQTLSVPSAEELGITSTTTTTTAAVTPGAAPATVPAYWTTPIYSPLGAAYLASNAAAAWESLRQAGLATYGIDIYPAGALSA